MDKNKRKADVTWFKEKLLHTANRAKERYGIDLTIEQYLKLCNTIKNSRKFAKFIRTETTLRQIWKVKLLDTWMLVCYDKPNDVIITLLPKDYLDEDDSGSNTIL